MKTPLLPFVAVLAALAAIPVAARAQSSNTNLVPNWKFDDRTNPLSTWRLDFSYQEQYVKNAGYAKISDLVRDGEAKSVEFDLPKGVAENQGAKIETALIKIEPGATYHASVDVNTYDLSPKFFVEVYALDPTSTPITTTLDRIPAQDGLPALVKCYRAGFDDPPAKTKSWVTVKRDFTVPADVIIAGKPTHPVYATIKAWAFLYEVGSHGKAYFSKFVLTKTKSALPPHS